VIIPTSRPSGVPATIQDQFEFLASLSKEQEYTSLLSCIEKLPVRKFVTVYHYFSYTDTQTDSTALVVSRPGPKWASWLYDAQYLPIAFHSSPGPFEDFIKWLKSMPHCSPAMVPYSQRKVIGIGLAIGLVLRDLYHIQFELGEDKSSSSSCPHLLTSQLTWEHANALLQRCAAIEADLVMIEVPGPRSPTPAKSADVRLVLPEDPDGSENEEPLPKKSKGNTRKKGDNVAGYVS
jgi:hypothetical protein